jgi:hypothetical protein
MFTIDLLKGAGIPAKSRPEGVVIGVVAFAVPAFVAIAMFGLYGINGIRMSIETRDITRYAERTKGLSGAVKQQESLDKEKNTIISSLSEVASCIDRHSQWSPVLVTLVENMPTSMVLTKLELKKEKVKKRVPSKDDPKKLIAISIPKRTLRMNVCGSRQFDCKGAVQDFKDRLWNSKLLSSKLENIRLAHENDTLEGKPVISFQIDCVFKPGL